MEIMTEEIIEARGAICQENSHEPGRCVSQAMTPKKRQNKTNRNMASAPSAPVS
jgi:hypothetical protein